MDSLRVVPGASASALAPCSQCEAAGCQWDQVMGRPFCPDCEEALALGQGPPLVLRTRPGRCAVCDRQGTVPFLTFPLHAAAPVEIDLCGHHFRALLGRRLTPDAFHQLARRLRAVEVRPDQVFLLHEVFYDVQGRALQPVLDLGSQ